MKWRIVRRSRSFVRIELFVSDGFVGRQYIGIEGGISKGYRWYSGTEIGGIGGFEGTFREKSQERAITQAILLWKNRIMEITNLLIRSKFPGEIEAEGGAS